MLPVFHSPYHAGHATARDMPGCAAPYLELPARAAALARALRDAGHPLHAPDDHGLEPLLAVHSAEYLTHLRRAYAATRTTFPGDAPAVADTFATRAAQRRPSGYPARLGYFAFDTECPILAGTWDAAYWSAQCAVAAADAVAGGARAAYALCRPPGHHAGPDWHGGYCYVNNAAVAVRRLQQRGRGRVAVVDIDFHHGNGTQAIFRDDPSVLFTSLHADPDAEYPYFWGDSAETDPAGTTRNWPLPPGTGDRDYLAALDDVCSVVSAFAPDAVVISAGFDIMAGDPSPVSAGFGVTPDGLAAVARRLRALDRPTVIVQEGGYAVATLGDHARRFLAEIG